MEIATHHDHGKIHFSFKDFLGFLSSCQKRSWQFWGFRQFYFFQDGIVIDSRHTSLNTRPPALDGFFASSRKTYMVDSIKV